MIRINDKEIKEFEADLKVFASRAYPFATKNTLNRSAFAAQKIARKDVMVKMIQRNRFSVQSVQVDQARTLIVSRQSATVGSIASYMEDQEFGTTITKGGKYGVPIPTSYAAGQGENAQPRTRLPRKANTMAAIKLQRTRKKGFDRRQRNLSAIKEAASSGRKHVFLDLGRKKGIFRVVGGVRRPRIKMVYDMTEKSVTIPKNPWLKPAVDTAQVMMPTFYKEALIFQLRRHNLFRG